KNRRISLLFALGLRDREYGNQKKSSRKNRHRNRRQPGNWPRNRFAIGARASAVGDRGTRSRSAGGGRRRNRQERRHRRDVCRRSARSSSPVRFGAGGGKCIWGDRHHRQQRRRNAARFVP